MADLSGLTSEEVINLRKKYGPNIIPEKNVSVIILFLQKFWSPISWVLEVIIILEFFLGRYTELWIIFLLLLFNSLLSLFQEKKANKALRLLKNKLSIQAKVLRDGSWQTIAAKDLVPQDIISLQTGDIIPADVVFFNGSVLVDQSTLTGESLPIEGIEKNIGYASSLITSGKIFAKVVSTGKNTYFGKTAELVGTAKSPSHLERLIFLIIKYLVIFDSFLVLNFFIFSIYYGFSYPELIIFSLLLLVSSVPIALPATYTLATALGSQELAKYGVLITKLSAIEEAAAMNILCIDKTGTITKNSLELSEALPLFPYSKEDLLYLASLASDESSQLPIDIAVLNASKKVKSLFSSSKRIDYTPFDPRLKYSKSIIEHSNENLSIYKGSPSSLLKKIKNLPDISLELERMSSDGSIILTVVGGKEDKLNLIGFLALKDFPRDDSETNIKEIQNLGIKIMMITGDTEGSAKSIAKKVGLGQKSLTREDIYNKPANEILDADIIAQVLPEDKFHIIKILQDKGFICGMTGDGVNDAPALKKAEVGIAMSNATDIAKASASIILTSSGLKDIVAAIRSSRSIYQRMFTYTLNKIIKTFEISVLLTFGLMIFHNFIISQVLLVLLLFSNDFVTMSISTDKVTFSQKPDRWDVKKLMLIGAIFAFFILTLSFSILFLGKAYFHLPIEELRSLTFLILIYTGQATIYMIRERRHFWSSSPSLWMIISSLMTISITSVFAISGIFMDKLTLALVLSLLCLTVVYFATLDLFKTLIFNFLKIK